MIMNKIPFQLFPAKANSGTRVQSCRRFSLMRKLPRKKLPTPTSSGKRKKRSSASGVIDLSGYFLKYLMNTLINYRMRYVFQQYIFQVGFTGTSQEQEQYFWSQLLSLFRYQRNGLMIIYLLRNRRLTGIVGDESYWRTVMFSDGGSHLWNLWPRGTLAPNESHLCSEANWTHLRVLQLPLMRKKDQCKTRKRSRLKLESLFERESVSIQKEIYERERGRSHDADSAASSDWSPMQISILA